jgi:membrane-bound ClpP family serine protease
MDPLIWSVLLMLLAVVLVIAEIFTPPPYGIIGLLAVTAAGAAIWLAFQSHGPVAGFAFTAVAIVGLPATVGMAVKYWPHSSIGRRVMLDVPTGDDVLPDEDPRRHLQQLVGKIGQARTLMVPGGAIAIEGRTYEAVSEGMPIEAGEPVQVVQVRHNRLVVRKSDTPPPPPKPDDVLSQPIDSLGLEAFEDPLA